MYVLVACHCYILVPYLTLTQNSDNKIKNKLARVFNKILDSRVGGIFKIENCKKLK